MNIIKWIMNFISNRFFKIKINNTFSPEYSIETGVPQGGVLSPTLFSIYINDIIFENTNKKTPIISSLFADDLSSSCSSKSLSQTEKQLNIYLKKLEGWLIKWRLNLAPEKCQYIIFSKDTCDKNQNINIKLFNVNIP